MTTSVSNALRAIPGQQALKRVLQSLFAAFSPSAAQAITATAPAAITALAPPAGGTGATAGAYDTANNRDAMITSQTALRTDIIALRTTVAALVVDVTNLQATLAAMTTLGT